MWEEADANLKKIYEKKEQEDIERYSAVCCECPLSNHNVHSSMQIQRREERIRGLEKSEWGDLFGQEGQIELKEVGILMCREMFN